VRYFDELGLGHPSLIGVEDMQRAALVDVVDLYPIVSEKMSRIRNFP